MNAREFLQTELDYAERHLARIRRLQTQKQHDLEAQGLDEVAVYEQLAASKAHRQLQRDEAFYQQMWLRLHRHLERLQPAPAGEHKTPITFRKPATPTRNQMCPCGSGVKYKRCCGNPLRQTAA
jgi:uncharacterized protein YecA (UPF0149 family)